MNKLMLVATFCAVIPVIATGEMTDDQLKNILHRATQYIDDPHGGPGEVRYAIRLSNNDTNRVVSLMKQMIDDNTTNEDSSAFYISEIGRYGTISDLSFLYQKVSSTNLCEYATVAILRIEGLTTNSLTQVTALLPKGKNREAWGAMCSRARLLQAARILPVSSPIRALTVSNAVQYAFCETEYPSSFDKSIRLTDPTYAMSKRRLAALRSVRDLGVNEWQTNFVTQAIRELEAYPEANLPE